MNIHEYQAKETLKSYGVNIQEGIVAENAAEAVEAAKKLTAETGTSWWVIKAQIHVYLDSDGSLHLDQELSWWFGFTDRIKGRIETFKEKGIDDVADHSMDLYHKILNKNLQTETVA